MRNRLCLGDNLAVMRGLGDGTVDLAYLDPPFNSNTTYGVPHTNGADGAGARRAARLPAFGDTWRWDEEAARAYETALEEGGNAADALAAMRTLLGPGSMLAYLSMMAPRLLQVRRLLAGAGSVFLHCDATASHYLRILMDAVFGAERFRNEIAWCYWGPSSPNQRQFSRKHDVILWYAAGDRWTFNADAVRVPHSDKTRANYRAGLEGSGFVGADRAIAGEGKIPEDWWPMAIAARRSTEYLRYPTQKPEELLRRVVLAASNEGDVVLDPFCGSGTAVSVAHALGRRWIGIDTARLALGLTKHRLRERFGPEVAAAFTVVGEPTTLEEAQSLAGEDGGARQFALWAVSLVGARPVPIAGGPDAARYGGVEGMRAFHEGRGRAGGTVVARALPAAPTAGDVRTLKEALERRGARMGVLVSLGRPTAPAERVARASGTWDSALGRHPLVKLMTVEDGMAGARVDMPDVDGGSARSVSRVRPGGHARPARA